MSEKWLPVKIMLIKINVEVKLTLGKKNENGVHKKNDSRADTSITSTRNHFLTFNITDDHVSMNSAVFNKPFVCFHTSADYSC